MKSLLLTLLPDAREIGKQNLNDIRVLHQTQTVLVCLFLANILLIFFINEY